MRWRPWRRPSPCAVPKLCASRSRSLQAVAQRSRSGGRAFRVVYLIVWSGYRCISRSSACRGASPFRRGKAAAISRSVEDQKSRGGQRSTPRPSCHQRAPRGSVPSSLATRRCEGRGQQPHHDVEVTRSATCRRHGRHLVIADGVARHPAGPRRSRGSHRCADIRPVSKRSAMAIRSSPAIGVFELGQRAQRQAERVCPAAEFGLDLAAMPVRHAQACREGELRRPTRAPARRSPRRHAGRRIRGWRSGTALRSTPKSGTITCQLRMVPLKKQSRIGASDAASLKMPAPRIAAELQPAPASSSRHCPADSWWRDVDRLGIEADACGCGGPPPSGSFRCPSASIFSRRSRPRLCCHVVLL